MLWHTREGKLKSTPVVKEGMLLYKLTIMDNVCFCKKGEISVPKRLGDCLDDLGIRASFTMPSGRLTRHQTS